MVDKFQPLKPLANIPCAFGFGWTDAGTITVVSSPSNWPVFPLSTSEKDHSNRLEACRTLGTDLLASLRARKYQVRGEFVDSLKKYVSRLPDAPGTGNILLADAEARTLRNLFAAEAEILSPGFATRLKTLLEHHIGLRPFYPQIERFYRDVQSGRIETPLPQDAVEGFMRGVRDNTPSVFDPSVSSAADASRQLAPSAPTFAGPDEGPAPNRDDTLPPADPLKELDPRKARDYTIGGVVNALWKIYLEGDKVPKAAAGWKDAGDSLQPYVQVILDWLRSFIGS